jgi:hypothetical protein
MRIQNSDNIEATIRNVATQHNIVLQDGDVPAIRKAYIKFGDIDLALNVEGDVLSDVMEETQLDIIADALAKEFGLQKHTYPHQIYLVKINGHSYKTYIDEYGEQKFVGNKVLSNYLLPNINYDREKHLYQKGEYSTEEWIEFNAMIGTGLKEFLRTVMTCLDIENPREMV